MRERPLLGCRDRHDPEQHRQVPDEDEVEEELERRDAAGIGAGRARV